MINVEKLKESKTGRAWLAAYVRRMHDHVLGVPTRELIAGVKVNRRRPGPCWVRRAPAKSVLLLIAAGLAKWPLGGPQLSGRLTPLGREVATYCRRQRGRR